MMTGEKVPAELGIFSPAVTFMVSSIFFFYFRLFN